MPIAILYGLPDKFKPLVGRRSTTRVHIYPKIVGQPRNPYGGYQVFVDYHTIIGRLLALRTVPCAGMITCLANADTANVTGAVHVWAKAPGIVIDELSDMLETSVKRFRENHPLVTMTIIGEFHLVAVNAQATLPQRPPT